MIDIELDKAISAAMHAGGTSGTGLDPLPSAGNLLSAAEGGDGGGGNAFALDGIQNSNASYPEAFRVVADNPNGTSFHVNRPVVCDGTNVIEATGGTGLAGGDYYCRIDRDSSGTVTATIQDSSDAEDDTILIVPIATIDSTGIKQHHLGVIVLPPGGSGEPTRSAFELEVTESSSGTKTGKIVRCNFVFDGENKSLPDFSVSGSGPVYLVAKQPAPSGGMGDLPWTFEISESKGAAEKGGRVVNYKLYDLNGFAVTCDYRTTFMELKSPHHVSKFTVSKYAEPQSSVVIEACQDAEAKITVSGNESHSLTLKASEGETSLEMSDGDEGVVRASLNGNKAFLQALATQSKFAAIFENGAFAGASFVHDSKQIHLLTSELNKGNSMRIHVLTVKDINGNVIDELNVLSTKDITIVKAQGTVLKDISLQYTNYELQMTKTKVDLATGQETTEGPSRVFPTELHSAQS